ncbi:MAG: nitrate reductase [Proteobacteria bacterium]|nr:MAG: nitrate reductase [Pseudomonadota bacterium]
MLKINLLPVLAVGIICSLGFSDAKVFTEEELGVRKSNLYNEELTMKGNVDYSTKAPGESKRIERSFENAPPLIPHSVEGLLPITRENNMCISCHAPEVASAVGATPVPNSHVISYRPVVKMKNGEVQKEGKAYANTADVRAASHKRDGISMDRFNCSLCHVPQTNNEPLVKNEFKADFRNKGDKQRSNLADILNEGVSYQ